MAEIKDREGFVIWLTGLSGSGKTTLSFKIEKELKKRGMKFVQRLDGDVIRQSLNKGLGFSREDRDENIRRVGFVAKLLSNNGVATICAFISPYHAVREEVRKECKNFIEIYVRCPLEILIMRDPKGLYKRALTGEIKNFTGIDDPYEEPANPEIIVDTSNESLEESTEKILKFLEERDLIPQKLEIRE